MKKRIVCLLTALILMAVVLTGCQSDTVLLTTAGGTQIDMNRQDITGIKCAGSVNGEQDFLIEGEEAQQLFDYIRGLCTGESETPEPSANLIHLNFSTTLDSETAWLGDYTVQDNGMILFLTSPVDSYMHTFTCDKNEYDAILKLVQP